MTYIELTVISKDGKHITVTHHQPMLRGYCELQKKKLEGMGCRVFMKDVVL